MKGNNLKKIQPNTLTKLSELTHLDIRENSVGSIGVDMLSLNGSTSCEILLQQIGIKEMETGSFKNIGNSSSIFLSTNSIKNLPSRVFYAHWLNIILLKSNKLQHIHPEAFAEVGRINILSLNNNLLTEIPPSVYSLNIGFSLDLSVNRIDLSFHPNRSVLDYSTKILFLSKNNIQSIYKNYFCGLKSLQQLFIYLNDISYIEDGSFSGTSLQSIFIYGNRLTKITSEMFNVQKGSLTYLYIFNNPVEDIEQEALSHLAPNSEVYLECANLDYIPSKIADNTIAKCLTNKTKITFDISNYNRRFDMLGMTCNTKTCEPCAFGFYGILNGAVCNPCPPGGFYQDQRGYVKSGNYKSDCKQCPIGTFSPYIGAVTIFDCRSCPIGTDTDEMAALNACPCLKNFHRTYRYGACQPCQKGLDCTGGYQKLRTGYWWSWNFAGYSGPEYTGSFEEYNQFVKNLSNSHFQLSAPNSLYDTQYKGFLPAVHPCPRIESCRGGGIEANCSEGYSSWLCAECSAGYYELFDKCHECQDIKIIILVMVLVLLTFIGVAYGVWRLDKRTRTGVEIRKDSFVIHLKIAINFYQVLGILSAVNEIHWPDSFHSVGQGLQYLDIVRYINVLSPRCMFPGVWNAYTYLYIAIATPFFIILLTSVTFYIWYIYKRYKYLHHSEHHLTDNFLSVTMVLLYLTYANTCSNIMAVGPWSVRTFNVTANGTYTKQLLTSDYSIDLDEDGGWKYKKNKYITYFSLLYVIFFPLAIIMLLYRRYKRYEEVGRQDDERPGTMGMRFFCKQYRNKFWYWEVIDMYNKSILALIANFKDDQASNMSYSLFITVILIALHLYLEPMRVKSDQRLQLLTLVFIIVNLSIGAIVDIGESVYTVDETILVLHEITPFILLLLNLSIVFVVFVDLLKKIKESLWGEWIGSQELNIFVSNVQDTEDNEFSSILQADSDILSNYNQTIHN